MRTPSWIRWPGTLEPRTTDEPWAFWDALPTFADLAGADASLFPADIDGVSIVPLLEGAGAYNATERPFYFEFCTNIAPWVGGRDRKGWTHAVRQGRWKLVSFTQDMPYKLFDLEDDLSEENDLADKHPEIVSRLAAVAKEQHTDSPLFPKDDCIES